MICLALLVSPARGQSADDETPFDATTTVGELFAGARDAVEVGQYDLAERFYEEILLRHRTHLQAMLELSTVYERTGKLEYARGLLIRATRIDPGYTAIVQRRESVDRLLVAVLTEEADSMLARGSYESAMAKLSLHLAIEPGNAAVHYKRALCLFEMGRYDAALTDAEAAISIDAHEPYFVLRDRIIGGQRQDAVQQLTSRAATLARSDNPRNREQALELIAHILAIDPEHTWARNAFLRLSEVEAVPEAAAASSVQPRDEGPSTLQNAVRAAGIAVATVARFIERHLRIFLAFIAVLVVFRSPLTRALTRLFARTPLLAGQLARFSVPEVLTMINAEPRTGVIDINAAGCRGKVYFENGEPCHCTAGSLEGTDALMSLIENARKGRFAFREVAMPPQRSIDAPLSLLLVEQAHKRNGVRSRLGVPAAKKSKMKELLDSRA